MLGEGAAGSSPTVDQAPLALTEQHLRPLARTAQSATAPLVATMTTITTGSSTEHSLATLSTSVGQQDEWLAQDRQWVDELSQQLSDTTMQLAHISKVLDHLLENHTPMAMTTGAIAVPVTSSVSGTAPSGQVAAHSHQSTASCEANPSTSSLHINRQAAPLSNACFSQPSQDLQDQAFSLWDQANSSTSNHSSRPFLPSNFLAQFPASLDPLALGQHAGMNQQQHQQVTIAIGLPRATQYSTTDKTSHGRMGLATLPATRPQPYNIQTAASGPNMAMDISMMAKVIHNMPPKLQQRIIQGHFIDLSELLQVDFQFKYASVDSNDVFKLIYKDETVLMQPRKEGKQINCLSTWLSAWALYEQVMVYAYPQRYPKLAYYRNFIMQQDKKFIWPTVQMFDIRYHAMCAHHSCPFTMTDQALMATILDATAVKVSVCKCFQCGGLDHLVDGCPFPQTASLEMVETLKKGA